MYGTSNHIPHASIPASFQFSDITQDEDEHMLFMGNLKKDGQRRELEDAIYHLFTNCLNISLIKYIIVKGKSQRPKHALIYLHSKEDTEKACNLLRTKENRARLRFNFLHIVEPSKTLKVEMGNQRRTKNFKEGGQKDKRKRNDHLESRPHVSDFVTNNIHVSTGTGKPKYYVDGETLGNETRNKEFKEGGGDYITQHLQRHVSKYICGFLNSSQQGTLFIGVKDNNGSVVGIRCNHETEDNIRLRIDQTIKTIKPPIFPQNYRVEFVPVCFKDGSPKDGYKVLEITVENLHLDSPSQLYEAGGEVYVKLDGSVQGPLKPFQIQEWLKQVHKKELQKALQIKEEELQRKLEKQENNLLKESDTEKSKIEEKEKEISNLQKKIAHIEEENAHLKKKLKSKICVII